MRILLASPHRFPAERAAGAGNRTAARPTVAPARVHDLIARGLAELGHEVFYLLEGADAPLTPGVTAVTEPPGGVDVLHNLPSDVLPWIETRHRFFGAEHPAHDRCVFVSRSLAEAEGRDRFVANGLDPEDYFYAETKEDYLLFLAAMQGPTHAWKYHDKGLDVALAVARDLGVRLMVAGTAREQGTLELVAALCREHGAVFLGDVRGRRKVELLAGARALIFPTRRPEGCPLAVLEALFSGTPVLASDVGVCRELVTPEVGFVCAGREDYLRAFEGLSGIAPRACREKAMAGHHYLRMAEGYVREYEREVSAPRGDGSSSGSSAARR